MESKHVICPESDRLETIECEDHPLGILISACSRQPGCALTCQRMCAARLDRHDPIEPSFEEGEEDTRVNMPATLFLRWLG